MATELSKIFQVKAEDPFKRPIINLKFASLKLDTYLSSRNVFMDVCIRYLYIIYLVILSNENYFENSEFILLMFAHFSAYYCG